MKKIVLEIDGVRHRLVEGDTDCLCDLCSITDFCGGDGIDDKPRILCDYPGYDFTRCRFSVEKDSELGSPLKVDFDD